LPEGLAIEDVGILYGHLVFFAATWYIYWAFGLFYGHLVYLLNIWSILRPLGLFYSHLVYLCTGHLVYVFHGYSAYFLPFWFVVQREIWQPCSKVAISGIGSAIERSLKSVIIKLCNYKTA
jgi:hypothetical protein